MAGKRGTNGRFVKAAEVKTRRRKSAGPSLAKLVDARIGALEVAIGDSSETMRALVSDRLTTNSVLLEDAKKELQAAATAIVRLPGEAACSVVDELDRRLNEGVKRLHRHVRVTIEDKDGVRMADQHFELAEHEQLEVLVSGSELSASQSQPTQER